MTEPYSRVTSEGSIGPVDATLVPRPGHIRESSRLLRPYNPALRTSPFAAQQVADAGDLAVNPFSLDEAIATVENAARGLLERADRFLALGGVLDPAHAPGTGTPGAGGLTSRELLAVLRSFASLNLVGADIVEVAPACDHAQITGIAAAHVAYELLSTLSSQPAPEVSG